jgi:DNA helicase HerA-like ATPase
MGRLLRLEDLVEERLLMGMGNGDYAFLVFFFCWEQLSLSFFKKIKDKRLNSSFFCIKPINRLRTGNIIKSGEVSGFYSSCKREDE